MSSEDEQAMAKIRDNIPRMWWNLYQGALQAGFKEPVAMALLKTFILGSAGARIVPPDTGAEPGSDRLPE